VKIAAEVRLGNALDAILQLLVALLPFVVTGIVQGLVEHRSRAARNRRPLPRRS
jgi:hypothetical protein